MQWILEDTIEIKIEEEVSTCHLEWVPKNDGQHILTLAISDMVWRKKMSFLVNMILVCSSLVFN